MNWHQPLAVLTRMTVPLRCRKQTAEAWLVAMMLASNGSAAEARCQVPLPPTEVALPGAMPKAAANRSPDRFAAAYFLSGLFGEADAVRRSSAAVKPHADNRG